MVESSKWEVRSMPMRRLALVPVILILGWATMGADSCGESGGGGGESSGGGGSKKEQAAKPATEEKPTPEEPELTSGQENALAAAQDYLDLTGMSKAGLIDQLSSPAGEGFSEADATFAANNVDVDWNAEAVEAAEDYLDISPMSKDALIDQLSSPAGEQFTPAQAQYAADKAY